MNYTNNQIKRILSIQEFLETANTLSKIYNDYDNKQLIEENITDKQRIYKLLCSVMYNLVDAIKKSEDIFRKSKSYNLFERIINQKYIADDNKYYSKENYESNLYKILSQIRHQNNHFEKDDNDDIVLFEVYIDFKIVDELRKIISEILYEIYNEIDKEKIKRIILSKPKIQYSFDKLSTAIEQLEMKVQESTKDVDKVFINDNLRAVDILREVFNPNNIYGLLNKDKVVIEKYDHADKEMEELFNKYDKYISEHGNETEKKSMNLVKEFFANDEAISKNESEKRAKKLCEELKSLSEENDGN